MNLTRYMKLWYILCMIIIVSNKTIKAQNKLLDQEVSFNDSIIHVSDVLLQMTKQGVAISYRDNMAYNNLRVKLPSKVMKVKDALNVVTVNNNLTYRLYNNHIIVKQEKRKRYHVSGYMHEAGSGEPLVAANVINPNTWEGTITNNYGFFRFPYNNGETVRFSHVGYEPLEVTFNHHQDTIMNIALNPNAYIEKVTISDDNTSFVKSTTTSNHEISLKQLESTPMLLGEKDVLKAMQLYPGIQSTIEGSTGLSVRGGDHSQNLILIDDVPVYNVDHLFGFFSIFNPDAIKSAKLYKGGFPARYGGRASSVLDIRMNEGNNQQRNIDLTIGTTASKIKIESPIFRNKTSFMLSGRRTNLDLPLFIINKAQHSNLDFGFSDIYLKLNHKLSNKSRLYLSYFLGKDKYKMYDETGTPNSADYWASKKEMDWKNFAIAFRWNYLINEKLFSNTTLTYSGFKYQWQDYETNSGNASFFNNYSATKDVGVKIDFDMPFNKHYIRYGLSSNLNIFEPFMQGSLVLLSDNTGYSFPTFYIDHESFLTDKNTNTFALSAYFEDDINLSEKFKTNLGLRYNSFFCDGKVYHSPEPRLSMRYLLSNNISLKTGYARMSQYIHQLSNSYLVLLFNNWIPSSGNIKPLFSDHFTVGSYSTVKDIHLSLEGFYKIIANDIIYKQPEEQSHNFVLLENNIKQGKRRIYGFEILAQKKKGNHTGWISYTFSRAERQFNGINNGNYYPFWLVRPHAISLNLNKKFNQSVDIGTTWTFTSGYSVNSIYETPKVLYKGGSVNGVPDYVFIPEANKITSRYPAYHRLDLGINLHKDKKKYTRTLSFGIYNAYGRKNPLLFSEQGEEYYVTRKMLVLPYITYRMKFY